ncbi:MAG: flagellar protein FlaG [Clostridiales bacterium]|nr:flagellar protein FlaG [Clostridiales bacterium]
MDVNLQSNGMIVPARPAPELSAATSQTVNQVPVREREVRDAPQQTTQAPPPQTPTANAAVQRQGQEEIPTMPQTTTLREEDVSDQMLERAFTDANRALAGGSFRLSYGVHQGTNRVTVAVYDANTDELIRELPPESRLDLYARITEFTGLLFDQSS